MFEDIIGNNNNVETEVEHLGFTCKLYKNGAKISLESIDMSEYPINNYGYIKPKGLFTILLFDYFTLNIIHIDITNAYHNITTRVDLEQLQDGRLKFTSKT